MLNVFGRLGDHSREAGDGALAQPRGVPVKCRMCPGSQGAIRRSGQAQPCLRLRQACSSDRYTFRLIRPLPSEERAVTPSSWRARYYRLEGEVRARLACGFKRAVGVCMYCIFACAAWSDQMPLLHQLSGFVAIAPSNAKPRPPCHAGRHATATLKQSHAEKLIRNSFRRRQAAGVPSQFRFCRITAILLAIPEYGARRNGL